MKKIKATLILFLSVKILLAQSPLVYQWDYCFGGTFSDELSCFMQTMDGGYILGGTTLSGATGNKTQPKWGLYDYWIVKIDANGIMQWDKDFGGTDNDFLMAIVQTDDKGYLLAGYSNSGISGDKTQPTNGLYDYWILKIDSLGNVEWDKDLGGADNDFLLSMQQTNDGGFILAGSSASDSSGDKSQNGWGLGDYWMVKVDSLGNKLWDKNFGGIEDDKLYSTLQAKDHGYILAGYTESGISGDKTGPSWGSWDYWIVKTDSLGNLEWDKDYGGAGWDYLQHVLQTPDKGYLLSGWSTSGISGDKTQPVWGYADYWIVKTDSLGTLQWEKDYGGTNYEELSHTIMTMDGGFLIAGDSYSPISGDKTEDNLGTEQTWIVKTDANGTVQWDKTILTTGHDEVGRAIQTKDKCYAIANYSNGGIGGYKSQQAWSGAGDYWIVRFCDTVIIEGIDPVQSSALLSISPNPFTGQLSISFQKHTAKGMSQAVITIKDMLGQIVFYEKENAGDIYSKVIDPGHLSKGIYLVEVDIDGERMVKKIVKE